MYDYICEGYEFRISISDAIENRVEIEVGFVQTANVGVEYYPQLAE